MGFFNGCQSRTECIMHFSRSEKRTIIITCSNNSQRPKGIIDGNPNKSGTDRIMSKPKESKLMKIAKT